MNGKSVKALLALLPLALIVSGCTRNSAANSPSGSSISPVKTFKGHTDMILSLAFAKNGRTLATASADRTVKLWDVKTGQVLRTLTGHKLIVWSVAISPDGKTVASGSNDGSLRIWDAQSGKPRYVFQLGPVVNTVAFSPNGKWIASGRRAASTKDFASLNLWNAKSGALVRSFATSAPFSVQGVAFSPDGKQLLSGGGDKTLRLWDVPTGRLQRSIVTNRDNQTHNGLVERVAFSPDGKLIAGGGWDGVGTVWVWNAKTGVLQHTLRGTSGIVSGLAFSPDGKTLAGATRSQVYIWNVQTGITRKSWPETKDMGAKSLAFTPDGQSLVTGSREGDMRINADQSVNSSMVGTIKFWSVPSP